MKKIIVLGAGPSGLSSAWKLSSLIQAKIDIFEKSERPGGVCGYHDFGGIRLDYGPHKIYSVIPGIMDVFREIGRGRLKEIRKRHKIILRGAMLDYPVRLGQLVSLFTIRENIAFTFSTLTAIIKSPFVKKALSYEDYCINLFGRKAYSEVFMPLAEKIWGDPRRLSADIARTRIPTKSAYDLIFRMLGFIKESKETNAEIMLYPGRGFYDICECIAGRITAGGHTIHLGKSPVEFVRDGNKIKLVIFNDADKRETDLVISTIPLRELFGLLFPEEKAFIDKGNFVHMRHSVIVYFLVDKPRVLNEHWVFCPDKDIIFSRISEQKLFSDECFPKDKTIVSCDFTCDEDSDVWKSEDNKTAKHCINGLERLNILRGSDIIDYRVARIPEFYPVYDIGYRKKIEALFERINSIENIVCAGRLGLCSYSNIDHCVDMGIFLAEEIANGKSPADINRWLIKKSQMYRIVD